MYNIKKKKNIPPQKHNMASNCSSGASLESLRCNDIKKTKTKKNLPRQRSKIDLKKRYLRPWRIVKSATVQISDLKREIISIKSM